MAFKKIEDGGTLPGPRAVFISGFSKESHQTIRDFLKEMGIKNINVVPCREDSINLKVLKVLEYQSESPIIPAEKLPPLMMWSGIDHSELDTVLGSFSETKLQRPIFCTSTEHNLDFTIKELINHLLNEQKAMREAVQKEKK